MPMSVNSFDTEPTRYTVLAVAAAPAAESAQPNPRAHAIDWPSTMAIEIAGIPLAARSASTKGAMSRATTASRPARRRNPAPPPSRVRRQARPPQR